MDNNKSFQAKGLGINVEGMGGIGEEAKQNIQNVLAEKNLNAKDGNAYGQQIMKANGQKGNNNLQ